MAGGEAMRHYKGAARQLEMIGGSNLLLTPVPVMPRGAPKKEQGDAGMSGVALTRGIKSQRALAFAEGANGSFDVLRL